MRVHARTHARTHTHARERDSPELKPSARKCPKHATVRRNALNQFTEEIIKQP